MKLIVVVLSLLMLESPPSRCWGVCLPTNTGSAILLIIKCFLFLLPSIGTAFACHQTSEGNMATYPNISSRASFDPSQVATASNLVMACSRELHVFAINAPASLSCQGTVKKLQICYWTSHLAISTNTLLRFLLLDKVNLQVTVMKYFYLNSDSPSCSPALGAQGYVCCKQVVLPDNQQFQIGSAVVYGLEVKHTDVCLLLLHAVNEYVGDVEHYETSALYYQGSSFTLETHQKASKSLPLLQFHIGQSFQS